MRPLQFPYRRQAQKIDIDYLRKNRLVVTDSKVTITAPRIIILKPKMDNN